MTDRPEKVAAERMTDEQLLDTLINVRQAAIDLSGNYDGPLFSEIYGEVLSRMAYARQAAPQPTTRTICTADIGRVTHITLPEEWRSPAPEPFTPHPVIPKPTAEGPKEPYMNAAQENVLNRLKVIASEAYDLDLNEDEMKAAIEEVTRPRDEEASA